MSGAAHRAARSHGRAAAPRKRPAFPARLPDVVHDLTDCRGRAAVASGCPARHNAAPGATVRRSVGRIASGFVLATDVLGSFAFALSGAAVGVRRRLDLFGVLVLWFAATTAGGVLSHVLIGATPPAALVDWRYISWSPRWPASSPSIPLRHGRAGCVVQYRCSTPSASACPASTAREGARARPGSDRRGAARHPRRRRWRHRARRAGRRDPRRAASRARRRRHRPRRRHRGCGRAARSAGGTRCRCGGSACFAVRFMAIRRGWALPVATSDAEG